ncbi:nucleotide exchange factor GrpE [bacterium]|nr:nucleotide exchange factor GrpE [bacterium]
MGEESTEQKVESEEVIQSVDTTEAKEAAVSTDAEESEKTQLAEDEEESKEEENSITDLPETMEQLEERYKTELAEMGDKYIRLAAEFENFKKRTNQEMQNRFKFANQQLALNIITGLDNLERALIQASEEEDNSQLQEFVLGIKMVQQQLHDALKQNNIERVYPKGELFDPNKHEAMGVIETEEVEPDHIAEVFQAGYFLHDRVIRPAMVQVAKKK